MPSSAADHTNTPTEGEIVRKVSTGTKIKCQTEIGIDYGIILEHQPSGYCKDVYLVKWSDGSQTLFELKKDNLIPKERKCPNKRKRN